MEKKKERSLSVRLLAMFLMAAMVCGLFAVPLKSEAAEADEGEVLEVGNLADWQTLQNRCSTKAGSEKLTVVLTADIDFTAVTKDIQLNSFYGVFEGGNHAICNVYQSDPLIKYNYGVVKNLIIRDSEFTGGALCSKNSGTIDHCVAKSIVLKANTSGYGTGIICENNDGVIKNCSNDFNCSIPEYDRDETGGIVGESSGDVFNCVNFAKMTFKNPIGYDYSDWTGGVVGFSGDGSQIFNCYSAGSQEIGGAIAGRSYGKVFSCFYDMSVADQGICSGTDTTTAKMISDIKTQAFCDTMNKNRGSNTDWREWVLADSGYPEPVEKLTLSDGIISIPATSYGYTGKEIVPAVTITYNSEKLKENIDYKLTYTNNLQVGKATIKAEGIGGFEGTLTQQFNIEQVGWVTKNKKWYYYDKNGNLVKGWQLIDKKWYYMDSKGIMQTGWVKYNNKWYFLNASGVMQYGWKQIKGSWYYFGRDGIMRTGWTQVNGKWYLFKGGVMQVGWTKVGAKWYFFKDGAMKTGWLHSGGKWYYFNSEGVMVTGSKKIGGKTYQFSSEGVCLNP